MATLQPRKLWNNSYLKGSHAQGTNVKTQNIVQHSQLWQYTTITYNYCEGGKQPKRTLVPRLARQGRICFGQGELGMRLHLRKSDAMENGYTKQKKNITDHCEPIVNMF